VSEWFKVPLSKSGVVKATAGSNPALSGFRVTFAAARIGVPGTPD
jgi:hypothetical protein